MSTDNIFDITNENDFKDGIKFLKRVSSKCGLYSKLMMIKWIVPFSKVLASTGNCKRFWENTFYQNNLTNIPKCVYVDDVFYGHNSCLFLWCDTPEGHSYWESVCDLMIRMENKRLVDL